MAAKKPTKFDEDAWRVPPRLQAQLATPGGCRQPLCGAVADDQAEGDPALAGMVRVGVYGSAEPDRIWCGGTCAMYGTALAEVRVRTGSPS